MRKQIYKDNHEKWIKYGKPRYQAHASVRKLQSAHSKKYMAKKSKDKAWLKKYKEKRKKYLKAYRLKNK